MSEVVLDAGTATEAREARGLGMWLTTTDHKRIGQLYLGAGFAFFTVAVVFAMLMRTQLIRPGMKLLTPQEYDQIFSMHGTTMVFLFAMPILIGLANYLVPLMIGARDMAFPRLNALGFWAFLFGGLLLYSSFAFGGALNTGWFSYAPLTMTTYSPTPGVTFWCVSLALLGLSSIVGAINFIVTMARLRAPGMSFMQMPVFAIATYINSFLILFAFPSLTAAVVMLYFDRTYGTVFFNPAKGGDALMWQHLFWFFGHPEVYILILPAFGVISEVVPIFTRKPLFGRTSMVIMLAIIGVLGFLVWAHHMFTTGLPNIVNTIMAGTSMLIAIPTGVKIFNWLATMWGGAPRFRTPLLFSCGLITLFTIGGITGVMQAVYPFDWQAHDTYFIVAHLHNVLFAGTVFAVFAGIYYWFPKMTGRRLNDRLGKWHFWVLLVGFSLTFLPMYALGLMGMPRRVYTYAGNLGWNDLNLVSSIGGYIIATALIIFAVNVVRTMRHGEPAGDDPWDAWTLEWATTSPPPSYNFLRLPRVRSERPLWDMKQAAGETLAAAPAVEAAGPGARASATLAAEAGATAGAAGSAALAVAQADATGLGAPGVHLHPHYTSMPFFIALCLLGVAAGLLSSLVVSVLAMILMLVLLAVWMLTKWPPAEAVPSGKRFSAAGLGMLVFIASESVYFGGLVAADVHMKLHSPSFTGKLHIGLPLVNTCILAASGIAMHYAQVSFVKGRMRGFHFLTGLTILLGAIFLGGQAWEYTHAGFGLSSGVLGSVFFVLTGFHGFHVLIGLVFLLFLYIYSRDRRNRELGNASTSLNGMVQAGTYYWHFVDAVWVAVFITVYLL